MNVITADKFLKNLESLKKNAILKLENQIVDLFEPVVYQIVLLTRMDTGRARAELAKLYADKAKPSNPSRLLQATQYDIEVNEGIYDYWKNQDRNNNEYTSTLRKLIDSDKMSITITINDKGFVNQALGLPNGAPSLAHPRPKPERHPTNHVQIVIDAVNMNSFGYYVTEQIAKEIEDRTKTIIDKIVMELMS